MADPSSSDSLSILERTRGKQRSTKPHQHEQATKKTDVSDSRAHFKSLTLVAKQLKKFHSSPSTSGVFDAKERLNTSFSSTPTSIIRQTPKYVYLYDWWLIKVEGEGKGGLGIGGFTSGLNLGVRIFTSAAISTRHCDTVLETTDGITVRISDLLNIRRTCQNGFQSKVCSYFMHGFPYNWEDCAASCRVKESTHADTSGTTSTSNETNKFLGSLSLNDLPATAINDHLRSTFGHSSRDLIIENNICSNLSTSGNSEHSKAREDPKPKNSCSVVDKASTANATRVIQKKAKSESRQRPSREDVPAKQCRVTRSMSKRNSSLRVL